MFDAHDLIHGVLSGALRSRRRKRGRRALRFLTGGRGSLLSAGTLLTLGGLAWGAVEAATASGRSPAPAPGTGGVVPPPLPAPPGALPAPDVPEGALRLVRLAVSAAGADGALGEEERQAIVDHARAVGVGAVVEDVLANPRPLAEIVAGVSDPRQQEDLYVLAYAVVRADEAVSGSERIYLAQLAHALGLAADRVQALEAQAGQGIDQQEEEV